MQASSSSSSSWLHHYGISQHSNWPAVLKSGSACLQHTSGAWCFLPQRNGLFRLHLHPGKLAKNTIMDVWKMLFLFQGVMFRFHVNFPSLNLDVNLSKSIQKKQRRNGKKRHNFRERKNCLSEKHKQGCERNSEKSSRFSFDQIGESVNHINSCFWFP